MPTKKIVKKKEKKKKKINEMYGDLIIDSSGRNSQIERWLGKLDIPLMPIDRVDPKITYCTFTVTGYDDISILKRPIGEINFVYIMANPITPAPRAFIMIPTGIPNHALISFFGENDECPPTNKNTFQDCLNYAKTIHPDAYHILSQLTPVDMWRIDTYRVPYGNIWRRVDNWKNPPENLIILGDSQCCFNPVHAQGMTSALIHMNALDKQLRKQRITKKDKNSEDSKEKNEDKKYKKMEENGNYINKINLNGLSKRFYRDCSHLTRIPFGLAVTFDSLYSNVLIKYSHFPVIPQWLVYPLNKYIQHFLFLAHSRTEFSRVFIDLFHLTTTPFALVKPKLFLLTLWNMMTYKDKLGK